MANLGDNIAELAASAATVVASVDNLCTSFCNEDGVNDLWVALDPRLLDLLAVDHPVRLVPAENGIVFQQREYVGPVPVTAPRPSVPTFPLPGIEARNGALEHVSDFRDA